MKSCAFCDKIIAECFIGREDAFMKKSFIGFAAAICCFAAMGAAAGGFAGLYAARSAAEAAEADGAGVSLPDYSAGEGMTLDGLIVAQPVTFEAKIRLPENGTANASGSSYGVIFGNYSEKNTACAINYEVRENGCPAVLLGETYYKFDRVNLRTGAWIDLAIMIDESAGKIEAYTDGEKRQEITDVTFDRYLAAADKFSVGRDTRSTGNYADSFFMGEIEKIAVFSDARTREELQADRQEVPAYEADSQLIYKESYETKPVAEIQRKTQMYFAEEAFDKVPNSFEAWVRIPADLPDGAYGGVIFGNSRGVSSEEAGVINYEIGKYGHLLLKWNKRQLEYEFRKTDLRTGEWTHVAVVRNPEENVFSYYVNGELNETFALDTDATVSKYSFGVGSDFTNGKNEKKTPLYGDVKQVSAYASAIDRDRVKSDMKSQKIYGGNGCDLLGNWYFGETWNESEAQDTSPNANDMKRGTVDTFADTFESVAADFEYDYSFAVIPDTQNMVDEEYKGYDHLLAISNWIKDHAETDKIRFAMHLGDFVNTPQKDGKENTAEWQKAYDAMQILNGVIPYSVVPGNHDYDNMSKNRDLTIFNKYFGVATYNGMGTETGYYKAGCVENSYHKFTAGNVKYLVFALEFGARTDVLKWADRIADENSDCRIIVTTHAFLTEHGVYDQDTGAAPRTYGFIGAGDADYVNNGKAIWDKFVSRHSNIFMVLNGHYSSDDIIRKTYTGNGGNLVNAMFINAQSMLDCNEGMLAQIKVNEKTKQICVSYFSPSRGKYYNEQNQFIFSFADPNNAAIGGEAENTHTVAFETDGGSLYRTAVVKDGERVEINYIPEKKGYIFGGWYTDSSFVNRAEESGFIVTENVTLYAKWISEQTVFTVSFETNGGGTISDRSAEAGSLLTRPSAPVKEGYIFEGWYADENFSREWHFSTDRVTSSLKLYAKWKKEEAPSPEPKPEENNGEAEKSGCGATLSGAGATAILISVAAIAGCMRRKKRG